MKHCIYDILATRGWGLVARIHHRQRRLSQSLAIHAVRPADLDLALLLKGQQELHQILCVPHADASLPGPQ